MREINETVIIYDTSETKGSIFEHEVFQHNSDQACLNKEKAPFLNSWLIKYCGKLDTSYYFPKDANDNNYSTESNLELTHQIPKENSTLCLNLLKKVRRFVKRQLFWEKSLKNRQASHSLSNSRGS